jgi:hypothetical protein
MRFITYIKSHRSRVIVYAAIIHLCFVAGGAAKLTAVSPNRVIGKIIGAYQGYTGSGMSYGFFAPGVASQRRVIWHGYDERAAKWTIDFEKPATREVDLRLSTMAGLFSQDGAHDVIASSWAAWMFGKHTDTSISIVEVQAYVVPTMKQYRQGQRPQWQVIEAFAFGRDGARGELP